MLLNQFFDTADAKELSFTVRGFGDSVRMKHENVAGLQRDSPLVVSHVIINSQRKSRQLDFAATIIFVQQRLRLPGIGNAQFLTAFLPRREACSHEAPFDAPLA